MKKLLPILFIVIFGVSFAEAQNPKAWLDRVAAAPPPGPNKDMRPIQVDYTISWKGRLNAGEMQVVLTKPFPGVYQSKASGKSVGIARALFPYNFSGSAQTNAETLKPLTFNFSDKMKTKSYKYNLLFQPNQMTSKTELTNLKTGVKTPYHQVYRFDKDVGLDLMSSILYMRSLALSKGQQISLVTATFNKPYLTEYTVLGKDTRTIKGKAYKAIKLDVKISRIHANMTTEAYSKIDNASIWISDDAYRIPIEFQGDIFVGYIACRMTNRKWL